MPTAAGSSRVIEEIFWTVLGRAVTSVELRDEQRSFDADTERLLVVRLLSSPEFHKLRQAWREGRDLRKPAEIDAGLLTVGPDDQSFVDGAYRWLLGRPADQAGLAHYTDALTAGDRRANILRSLVLSEEFESHLRAVAPENGTVPRDIQLCELANPAKWDNDEWVAILRDLGLSDDKLSMHRKPYEFTQLIFGCRRLGVLGPSSRILSVGAGHELILYWLANNAGRVVATDMYQGVWQGIQGREGDPGVVKRPEDYAPFPYRQDRLVFLKMDGCRLAFPSGSFDIAYSLSSIEHFGGLEGAAEAVREMGRVLRPGGILALATEYVLAGPPHDETFQPEEFAALIDQPGMQLVEPFDDRVYQRYEYAAIDLYKNPYQAPHMVVRFNDTIFTTAMVFLRKLKAH